MWFLFHITKYHTVHYLFSMVFVLADNRCDQKKINSLSQVAIKISLILLMSTHKLFCFFSVVVLWAALLLSPMGATTRRCRLQLPWGWIAAPRRLIIIKTTTIQYHLLNWSFLPSWRRRTGSTNRTPNRSIHWAGHQRRPDIRERVLIPPKFHSIQVKFFNMIHLYWTSKFFYFVLLYAYFSKYILHRTFIFWKIIGLKIIIVQKIY